MLSDHAVYVVNLLLHLVARNDIPPDGREDGDFTTAEELAAQTRIPDPYLRKIVSDLSALGYLETKKGPGGGVRLRHPPEKVLIVELLEDVGELVHVGGRDACCRTREDWSCFQEDLLQGVKNRLLGDLTLAGLYDRLTGGPAMLHSPSSP